MTFDDDSLLLSLITLLRIHREILPQQVSIKECPVQTVPDIGDSEPRGSPKSRQMTTNDVYGRRKPRPAQSGHAQIRFHRLCIYVQCSFDNRCRKLSHAFLRGIWAATFHDPDIFYHQLLPPHKRIHSTSNSIAYVCAHQREVTHTSQPII
jgi:hypothetical protein